MDELYSNLDNYDEVELVNELRNENKNLKLKLNEYCLTTEKLQKDFDTLSSEFKRLEINYSSLLKTARAEVERKTQIITNLNLEKDRLVLSALQNGNQSLMHIRRNMTKKNKKTINRTRNSHHSNDSDSSKNHRNSRKELPEITKLKDSSSERSQDSITPSVHTAQNTKTDNLSKLSNKLIANVESFSNRDSDVKENVACHKDGYEGSISAQSGSIKQRRKSILALSAQEVKFSTDEEWDTDCIAKEQTNKEYSSRNEGGRNKIERDYNEKQDKKYSLPSNIEDNYYGSHKSSRETRKSRTYRNHDGDNSRSQDKYEHSHKSRGHTSSDRSHRHTRGDYEDRHNQRSGYRNRLLESPPPDKYSSHKRKSRDHRMNLERDLPPVEYGNKRHYQSERQTIQGKISGDYEGPSYKRMRTNSFHRHIEEDDNRHARTNSYNRHKDEDDNKHTGTNSYHRHIDEEEGWLDEINSIDIEALSDTYPDLRSCRSPDILNADLQLNSNHKVKEIKNTAETQMDDPRITSKRYVVMSDVDKVTMCAADSKNVIIKPIDKVKWGIHLPELLIQKPNDFHRKEINDDLVKEIYMDIDIENPISNLSTETGELYFGSESVPLSVTKESDYKYAENEKQGEKTIKNILIPKVDDPPKALSTGYVIPKLKHGANVSNSNNTGRNSSGHHKTKTPSNHKEWRDKIDTKDFKKKTDSLIKSSKDDEHKLNQQDCQKQDVISNRQFVEGDLELSDEASDNIELQLLKDNHRIHDPKQCNTVNTVKKSIENVKNIKETTHTNKMKVLDDKHHKTNPKKQHSSIFDIQHDEEMKVKADTMKSNNLKISDESQKINNKNDNQLPKIDIQQHDIETKEASSRNKEKQLDDKNRKTHQRRSSKSTLSDVQQQIIETKEPETNNMKEKLQDASKLKNNQNKQPMSIFDIQQQEDENHKDMKIITTANNKATCLINQPVIQKHVEEIKDRANTNKNNEHKRRDKNRISSDNSTNPSSVMDIQASEEHKDKRNEMQEVDRNEECNHKQEHQSMKDISINIEDTEVQNKHVEKTNDKCNDDKEFEVTNNEENTDQKHDNASMIDIQNNTDNTEEKSDNNKEIILVESNPNRSDAIIKEKEKISKNIMKTKSKKMSKKQKETQKESLEDSKPVQKTVKNKSKKDKDNSREIKNKFTDLFGDSNSLITPEELGINSGLVETVLQKSSSYMPIFEDAQDAIDLKEMPDLQVLATIVNVALEEKSSSSMTKMESSTQHNATISDAIIETKNDDEVKHCSGTIAKVNENLNLEPLVKEPDVVKTIIISTGIQPSGVLENHPAPEIIRHENVNINTSKQTNYNVVPKSREFTIKALATSTPHKDLKVLEPEPTVPSMDNSKHTSEQSDTLDSQTDVDTDVPDVRIFVRRRRKVIKKPTT